MENKTNIINMTEGKPLPLMLRFSVPMLLSNILMVFYTLADSAIIGRILGVTAFAAVGATAAPHFWIFSIVMSMGHGFGIVFAQRFGGKDLDGLRRAFVTAVYLVVLIGTAIGLAGVFLSRFLLELLNTPAELMEGATIYLSFLLGGMLITFSYSLLGSILRALGDSKTPLKAMILSSIVNIALNIPLVLLFGIAGVAAGTLFAQLIACTYCFVVLQKTGVLKGCTMKWDSQSANDLLRIGLPMGARDAVIQGSGLIIQWFVNGYGVDFVAGVSIAKRMYSLLMVAGGAFEGANGVFIAQNFGAKKIQRVQEGLRVMVKLMLVSSVIVMAFTIPLRHFILRLLLEGEPERLRAVLDIGARQLLILTLGLPLVYLLFAYRSTLEGIGKPIFSVYSGVMELVFRIASILIFMPFVAQWGVLLADPIGWVGATGLLVIAYYSIIKKMSRDKQFA